MTTSRGRQKRKETEPRYPLRGLLVSQFFGAFNDNAWKIIVIGLTPVMAAPVASSSDLEAAVLEVMQFKLRKFSPDVRPASSSSLPASVA